MPAPPLSLAAIRQPAFLYGADGTVAEANDLADGLAGRPLAGMTPTDVVNVLGIRSPGGAPLAPADLPAARALRGEEVVDVPLSVTAAGGRTVHVLATAAPIRDGDAVVGALVVWQDVSVRETARASVPAPTRSGRGRHRRLLDAILGTLPYRVSLWGRDERLL